VVLSLQFSKTQGCPACPALRTSNRPLPFQLPCSLLPFHATNVLRRRQLPRRLRPSHPRFRGRALYRASLTASSSFVPDRCAACFSSHRPPCRFPTGISSGAAVSSKGAVGCQHPGPAFVISPLRTSLVIGHSSSSRWAVGCGLWAVARAAIFVAPVNDAGEKPQPTAHSPESRAPAR
jgi:hypothetical protein